MVGQGLQGGEGTQRCGGALQGVERDVERLREEIVKNKQKCTACKQTSATCSDDEDATSSGRFDIKLLSRRRDVMLVAAKREGSSV